MKIKLAKTSGFCIGVKNAVLRIIREINSTGENIFIYGPLIHNPQTIDMLSARGLTTINGLENIDDKPIAIRTHGIPLAEKIEIEKKSKRIINLTCPRVIKVQKIIEEHSAGGYFTIITGDEDHAEVTGLKSYAASGVIVISTPEDIKKIPHADKYVLVSQTTFDKFQFENIKNGLNCKMPDIRVFNTICSSTHDRQDEILKEIKNGTDAVVVIGGKDSANTKRLARICADSKIKTFHIETESELEEDSFGDVKNLLVAAGASTPGWIINNVLEKLEIINTANTNILNRLIKKIFIVIVRTNVISAISAFFVSLFAQKYSAVKSGIYPALISALYVFCALNFAGLSDIDVIKKMSPHKFSLLSGNRRILQLLAFLSGALYLALVFQFSITTIIIAVIASTAVLPRSVKLKINKSRDIKQNFAHARPLRLSVREYIYSFKNITDTLGWVISAAFIPLSIYGGDMLNASPVIIFIFCLILMRSSILDLITFQGDFILGRKTMPVLIGALKTGRILLVLSFAALISLALLSYLEKEAYILLYGVNIIFYLIIIFKIIKKEYLVPVRYEALAEINLLLFVFIFILLQIF